ncbi:mesoderm induction early response protein 3 isoform X2 [Megalops cyprinoides]|uniref:mesoderm induction early response protein 3 isoform X2 n=1 Tax=Megalops cyprinoides TaxID=118141 RepID=UPI0018651705|nr:mesoderm induction early response protein 3 isoform X2 [Megalops cyprinoides]
MAEASFGSSSPVGSLSSEDHDFDPTAEMLVHEYDDERTLEEEELQEGERNFSAEIADLEKEGSMPLEELLAIYRYEASVSTAAGSSMDSSSGELTDELPDMTLDKEEIAKDLLSGDYEEETQSSADDLTPSVTSHEATDFFPRTLRSNTIYDGDKESEGEEDGVSPEDSRKEIMVGSEYQAEVPTCLCSYGENERAYEGEDQLLWSPGVLPENKVRDFLYATSLRTAEGKASGAAPGVHVQDNEQALYELLKCNYNTQDALERCRSNAKSSKEESLPWSEEECRNFEHALQIYDKNFHLIQKHKVKTRTVAECVAFYYMWKKSERFDYFVQQNRFGKKKYSSYPGVTDLMDRLVDEAEGLAVDGAASVCSGGGRLEPSADQQLSLLNSITASDLTALSSSVATVCGPADSYGFPPLESLHQGSLGRDEPLSFAPNGDSDCLNMLDAGFYHAHSDLSSMAVRGKDRERPAARLKMGLSEPFVSNVSVSDLAVDFETRAHRIASAKMAVSVTDFGGLSGSEPNGFLSARSLHQQHTALQSE